MAPSIEPRLLTRGAVHATSDGKRYIVYGGWTSDTLHETPRLSVFDTATGRSFDEELGDGCVAPEGFSRAITEGFLLYRCHGAGDGPHERSYSTALSLRTGLTFRPPRELPAVGLTDLSYVSVGRYWMEALTVPGGSVSAVWNWRTGEARLWPGEGRSFAIDDPKGGELRYCAPYASREVTVYRRLYEPPHLLLAREKRLSVLSELRLARCGARDLEVLTTLCSKRNEACESVHFGLSGGIVSWAPGRNDDPERDDGFMDRYVYAHHIRSGRRWRIPTKGMTGIQIAHLSHTRWGVLVTMGVEFGRAGDPEKANVYYVPFEDAELIRRGR